MTITTSVRVAPWSSRSRGLISVFLTPSQLALAWVLAQGEDIVPIPGTKRRGYLEENVGALDVTLTRGELERLDRAAPKGATAGERYAAPQMQALNR